MAIAFDTVRRHVVLDRTTISAAEIWTAWVDWHAFNREWPLALRQAGGDVVDPGLGIYSPVYFFLLNGWRVRPMEQNHALTITGNLAVQGGGIPVVQTLGSYNVSVQYTVPVQAQGIATGGGGGGLTSEQATQLAELWRLSGLDASNPLAVTATSRVTGAISQAIAEAAGTVTVTRNNA